jgi:hypothetical protein
VPAAQTAAPDFTPRDAQLRSLPELQADAQLPQDAVIQQ